VTAAASTAAVVVVLDVDVLVDGVRVVVHFNFQWHVDHVLFVAAERAKIAINFRCHFSPFHSCAVKKIRELLLPAAAAATSSLGAGRRQQNRQCTQQTLKQIKFIIIFYSHFTIKS
jgi:hypothetical protein